MAVFCQLLRLLSFRDSISPGQQKEIEMMVDVVIWVGTPGAGTAGVRDIDDGPLVDALARCVAMPDRIIVERMSEMLDMPACALSVHHLGGVLALGVGLGVI